MARAEVLGVMALYSATREVEGAMSAGELPLIAFLLFQRQFVQSFMRAGIR